MTWMTISNSHLRRVGVLSATTTLTAIGKSSMFSDALNKLLRSIVITLEVSSRLSRPGVSLLENLQSKNSTVELNTDPSASDEGTFHRR